MNCKGCDESNIKDKILKQAICGQCQYYQDKIDCVHYLCSQRGESCTKCGRKVTHEDEPR